MSVVITILRKPQGIELAQTARTVSQEGLTMGRNPDNDWVLADPERFLSGCHCEVIVDGTQYFLVDRSTNGTYINNSGEPIGRDNQVKLKDGDIFEISDYQFQVSLTEPLSEPNQSSPEQAFQSQNSHSGFETASVLDLDDPFASDLSSAPLPAKPVESESYSSNDSFRFSGANQINDDFLSDAFKEDVDPLAMLTEKPKDQFGGGFELSEKDLPSSNDYSYSDGSSAMNESMSSWPATPAKSGGGLIPENWDDEEDNPSPSVFEQPSKNRPDPQIRKQSIPQSFDNNPESTESADISLSESEARRRALEKAYKKLKSENDSLKKQVEVLRNRAGGSLDRSLVDSMGLKEFELSDEKISEINAICGQFIRHTTEGLMKTLASRNDVKNTFRMNMTTIQPVENNPLKFSANVDDALENMFIKEGRSYKKPLETVVESFDSIAEHQVAILAGIRSAFKALVVRFDPVTLEQIFARHLKKSLIPRNEYALYWEQYRNFYEDQFKDLDSSFHVIFGDEFTLAYEEQLQKLSIAKRNRGNQLDEEN